MIDFPASPTNGQVFSAPNGVVYKYSATYSSWLAQAAPPVIGGVGEVTASLASWTIPSAGTDVVVPFATVQSGNSGLWYNTTTFRYTPPAGKYFLCFTATFLAPGGGNGTAGICLRKNGVRVPTGLLQASGSAAFAIPMSYGEYVDANGSDYFDWIVNNTSGTGWQTGFFSAFPLTGIQGPTGGAPGSVVGDFATAGSPSISATAQVMILPVINGNSGGYYNASTGKWTPPAGRYNFYAGIGAYSNASGLTIYAALRKNGVVVLAVNAFTQTNGWGMCPVEAQVDANGTDVFDVWGQTSAPATGSQGYFGAFPTQGMVGPPGPPGPPGSGPANADFCAISSATVNLTGTLALVVPPSPAIVGNVGGYYNAATGRYTPPAGRYLINVSTSAYNSGATLGTSVLQLRKNGTVPVSMQGATTPQGYQEIIFVEATVDANGTDYFEIWGNTGASSGTLQNLTFLATPTQGLVGPQGPQGPPGTGISWRQLASVTTIAQAFVDVTALPSDINHIQVMFDIVPTFNDVDLMVQIYDGSGVLDVTPAHYGWVTNTAYNNAPASSASILTTQATASAAVNYGIVLDYGASSARVGNQAGNSISGSFTIQNVRDTTKWKKTTSAVSYLASNGVYLANVTGGGFRNIVGAMTGFRLSFIGGSSIAAGGNVTVWGSP